MQTETRTEPHKSCSTDVLVVGAGPAGSVAASVCSRAGLATLLVDVAHFPRHRPGEYLTNGAVEFLAQHAGDLFLQLPLRISRTLIRTTAAGKHVAPMLGAHIMRDTLDPILIECARRAGARVQLSTLCGSVRRAKSGWIVRVGAQSISTRFLIDATGSARWLARSQGWGDHALSDTLVAAYSYEPNESGPMAPSFDLNAFGWRWQSVVAGTQVSCAMAFPNSHASPALQMRRRDVSWRISAHLADVDFAVAGDSAGCVDPAAANGIERALRSGLDSALIATSAIRSCLDSEALSLYVCSTTRRILDACKSLHLIYSDAAGSSDPVGFIQNTRHWREHDTARTS